MPNKIYISKHPSLLLMVGGGREPVSFVNNKFITSDPDLIRILDASVESGVLDGGYVEGKETDIVIPAATRQSLEDLLKSDTAVPASQLHTTTRLANLFASRNAALAVDETVLQTEEVSLSRGAD